MKDDDNGNLPRRRPGKRLTSPERWEITQLIKSGVLDVTEYPTFDEEEGVRQISACLHCKQQVDLSPPLDRPTSKPQDMPT